MVKKQFISHVIHLKQSFCDCGTMCIYVAIGLQLLNFAVPFQVATFVNNKLFCMLLMCVENSITLSINWPLKL